MSDDHSHAPHLSSALLSAALVPSFPLTPPSHLQVATSPVAATATEALATEAPTLSVDVAPQTPPNVQQPPAATAPKKTPVKRKQVTLEQKQHALVLLGYSRDGTFLPENIKEKEDGAKWTQKQVAKDLGVSEAAVTAWKKNSTRIMTSVPDLTHSNKRMRLRDGKFPSVERALYSYFKDATEFTHDQTLLRADVIRKNCINIKGLMVKTLLRQLDLLDGAQKQMAHKEISALSTFVISAHWIKNFMSRHRLDNLKCSVTASPFEQALPEQRRLHVMRELAIYALPNIFNTHEVPILFRSLPSRALRTADTPIHSSVRPRLTALLTVFADGTKAPLIIIGPCSRPNSFPGEFDPVKHLNVKYLSHRNAWNTKHLWRKSLQYLNTSASYRGQTMAGVFDNSSAHLVDYVEYSNLVGHSLNHLQPVDCGVGRAFKLAYRRYFLEHVLDQVDKMVDGEKMMEDKWLLMERTVCMYDAISMMKKAWDDVPQSVILKSWLKGGGLLAPFQEGEVRSLLQQSVGKVEAAVVFPTESLGQQRREEEYKAAQMARLRGELWLKHGATDRQTEELSGAATEEDDDEEALLGRGLEQLSECEVFDSISMEDMGRFLEMEEQQPSCEPVTEESILSTAVEDGLHWYEFYRAEEDVGMGARDGCGKRLAPTKRADADKYLRACVQLMDEVDAAVADEAFEMSNRQRARKIKQLLRLEIADCKHIRRRAAKQARALVVHPTQHAEGEE